MDVEKSCTTITVTAGKLASTEIRTQSSPAYSSSKGCEFVRLKVSTLLQSLGVMHVHQFMDSHVHGLLLHVRIYQIVSIHMQLV